MNANDCRFWGGIGAGMLITGDEVTEPLGVLIALVMWLLLKAPERKEDRTGQSLTATGKGG